MNRKWTEAYYDSVESYFWTSERLGHMPDPGRKHKKPAEIFKRLRRLEEPLNHLLGFFFALAPSSFVANLYRQFAGIDVDEALDFLGGDVQALCLSDGATQPDFAFNAHSYFLTIEAKVDSKSSVEQVAKYALLHQRVEAQRPRKAHALLYLSKDGPKDLFPGRWSGWGTVKANTAAAVPSINKAAFRGMTDEKRSQLISALNGLCIASMRYAELELAVREAAATLKDSEAEGVLRRLYEGLAGELIARRLV